jgi:hypothetical protein
MQKWDYLSIVVDHEDIHDPGRPQYVNGHELPNWQQGENIFGVVNKLGWKGWEPVSFGLGYPVKRQPKQFPLLFRRLRAQ